MNNIETGNVEYVGGLRPEYRSYERQKCFVGHSCEAEWRDDILSACADVLPRLGLEPWYAADHFDPTKPLRDKVVELVANARYGIYDLSSWQDKSDEWHLPRNVFIELGMAIVLNRPALLLRHTSNKALSLPACLQGVELLEFAGEMTLKRALEERLPQWLDIPPDRDWLNRFCIFGNRVCDFREAHPRTRQWGHETLRCHISDGLHKKHTSFQKAEQEEIRGAFEEVLNRYSDLKFDHLDELTLTDGYQFILCSLCQIVRSTPFAVYRILPHTTAKVSITIGMSIALETLFEYDIPKVLLVRQEQDVPSLLRGYEVIEAINSSEVKRKLKSIIPAVMQKVRETAWKPRPLPFVEVLAFGVELTSGYVSEEVNASPGIVPFQAPPLPVHFIARVEELEALKSQLMDVNGQLVLTSLQGMGGIGKTTLVTALAHDPEIQGATPDGVLWASLGSSPDPMVFLANWLQAFEHDPSVISTLESSSALLRSILQDKACLIVLDDLRKAEDATPLLVGGPSCRTIITTRYANVAEDLEARIFHIGVLSEETALEFIVQTLGRRLETDELPKARQIIRQCGGLPLALTLALAQIAKGEDWDRLLLELENVELGAVDLDSPGHTIQKSFHASVELSYTQLMVDEQSFFRVIGVFPEDFSFSVEEAAIIGACSEDEARKLLRRLMSMSLVENIASTGDYQLHPLLRNYAIQKLHEAGEWNTMNTRYSEALRPSLLHLMANFESALWDLVDRALLSRYGPDWETQLRLGRSRGRFTLGQILELVKAQRDIFEPLFSTSEAYETLVTSEREIIATRNTLAHSVPGSDATEMQRVQELVEWLLPMIREALGAIQSEVDLSSLYCFVIMPSAREFEPVFQAIRLAVEESTDYRCLRADSSITKETTEKRVQQLINGATLVIADTSTRNPNVMTEVEAARRVGKRLVIISQSHEDAPDVMSLPRVSYTMSDRGLASLQSDLARVLTTVTHTGVGLSGLPADLLAKCRTVLVKCLEFQSYRTLRATFVTRELSPFRSDLPSATNSADLVDQLLAYMLPKHLSDGRPLLPVFLATLHDRRTTGDALRDELETLRLEVGQELDAPTNQNGQREADSQRVESTTYSPEQLRYLAKLVGSYNTTDRMDLAQSLGLYLSALPRDKQMMSQEIVLRTHRSGRLDELILRLQMDEKL